MKFEVNKFVVPAATTPHSHVSICKQNLPFTITIFQNDVLKLKLALTNHKNFSNEFKEVVATKDGYQCVKKKQKWQIQWCIQNSMII